MKQPFLPFRHELVVVNFAGGGGACKGIVNAIGRHIDIAINHDPEAVAMHKANHPLTQHYCEDVFAAVPEDVTGGQPVGLAWFSPDCRHFSKAKGGKPVSKKIRGLAWVVIKWARTVKPRVIMLENVTELKTWGPLLEDNTPCPLRKGITFRRWLKQLENCGYKVEMRELRACDYGAPTIRKRLFIIARCDGQPIVWPKPSHGPRRKPYRTAAECIDFSIPCPSIFTRERPLAEATLRRIARGVMKYVVNNPKPFIVPEHLYSPALINTRNGERRGQAPRVRDIEEPMPTVTGEGSQGALVAAFLARHYGGHENDGSALDSSIHTVTAKDHHALVSSSIVKLKGTSRDGQPATEPLHTVQAGGNHYGEVRAFLLAYYSTDQDPRLTKPLGTVTTRDRFGLVTVHGEEYAIVDIGMRMLSPRELFRAQGFDDSYIIDPIVNGKPLTKTAQTRMAGNSVCPPIAEALVRANFSHEAQYEAEVA